MTSPLRRPATFIAGLICLLLVLVALWPQIFTPYDPLATNLGEALNAPSAAHPFGTDQTGRDVLSRVVFGARYSLAIGLGAAGGAAVLGAAFGVMLGLIPRWADTVVMRAIEVLMAFPDFLIALVVLAVLGPGAQNLVIAVLIGAIPAYIRLARAETLRMRQMEYVRASVLLGRGPVFVAARHVLPSVARSVLVLATIGVGTSIVAAAGLSFLGLGAQEPTPDWGLMLASSRNVLSRAWWVALFPGLALLTTVLAVSGLARGIGGRAR